VPEYPSFFEGYLGFRHKAACVSYQLAGGRL
jgi:hypothetical protein